MNTNHIKSYAPQARSAFIAAMTKQAAKYGITAKGIEPLEQKGELALIGCGFHGHLATHSMSI